MDSTHFDKLFQQLGDLLIDHERLKREVLTLSEDNQALQTECVELNAKHKLAAKKLEATIAQLKSIESEP